MDFSEQTDVFVVLTSELRLKLLEEISHGASSSPELADLDRFKVTAETIHNNLRELERTGFLEREEVYGPGNRPRDEFSLAGDIELLLSVDDNEYSFDFSVE